MKKIFLSMAIVFFTCVTPSFGAEENAANQLSHTKEAINASKKRHKQITDQQEKVEKELKDLQQEMVVIARNTSEKEDQLSSFEEKLAILKEQKKTRQNALDARQAEISTMISAMISLKKLPPEAIIAMPGKLSETIATARALSIITDVINDEAITLKSQLAELEEIEIKIRKNNEHISSSNSELLEKRENLAAKIKERTRLQNELGVKDQKERDQLAELTQKSKTLQELLDALNSQKKKEQQEQAKNDIKRNAIARHDDDNSPQTLSFSNGQKLHLPANGKIIRKYGTSQENEFAHGITLKTREKASVVSPFAGEVVYAGNFRDYGKMVIIRHGNDFHTLLSGMESLNCTPGQLIVKGEPIGTMGKSEEATKLYLELRKNSKPIDPMPFLHIS